MFISILRFDTLLFILIYIVWYVLVIIKPRKKMFVDYDQKVKYHHYFMIPCLNEEAVIAETIKFWDQIIDEHPDIKILLINDASEDDTESIIRTSIKGKGNYQLVNRVKPNAQTGKGDALNYAYQKILRDVKENDLTLEQCLITIFDADAIIKMDYLDNLEANFALDEIALVQSRIAIINRNTWLGLMQDIDFYTCVDGIQNLRESFGNVGAGGNGQSIRLSAIMDEQEPWGQALLEDFEFSTRLLMQGYKTRYLYKSAVYQQGVDKYWPFIRQRARWAQGGIQCLKYRKEIGNSEYLTMGAKFEMFYFMILPFISIVGIISYILLSIYAGFENTGSKSSEMLLLILVCNFLTGIIIAIKYQYQVSERFSILAYLKAIIIGCTIIIYDWCLVPCQTMAIYRQFKGSTDWVKTARENVNYESVREEA